MGSHTQVVRLGTGTGENTEVVSESNPIPVTVIGGDDGPLAVSIGAMTDAAATTDTGTFSLLSFIKRGLQNWTSLLGRLPASLGIKMAAGSLSVAPASDALFTIAPGAAYTQVTVTRPDNVTPYTAGDVVGGVIPFPAMGAAGSHCMLTSVDFRAIIDAIPSGMTSFSLKLYSGTPPSALADNAPWTTATAGDRDAFIGFIDLGSPADIGNMLFAQLDSANKQVKLGVGETALYGYLVTNGGFTPAANSEVYKITLRAVTL
jgi:hypothetical protein